MKQLIKCLTVIGLLVTISLSAVASLPTSRQATVVDATSPTDLMIDATGIYESDKRSQWGKRREVRKFGVKRAIEDARKAAIYMLLYTSSDPILNTPEEKTKFNEIADEFFDHDVIMQFITYEADGLKSKIMQANDTGVRVVMTLNVNREAIINDLESRGILISQSTLLDALGNPFIMVLPRVSGSPLDALESDSNLSHGANVIQGLLTNRQYDVVIPDQQLVVNNLGNQNRQLDAISTDLAYQLALSVGSDVYIDYSIEQTTAGYDTDKVAVQVRAFETTTSRLLGAETGYSQARQGDVFVSIEEALLLAINNLMARVNAYWKTDNQTGAQFKIVTTLSYDPTNEPSTEMIESVQDNLSDIINDIATKTKVVSITDNTVDVLAWVDPDLSGRLVWRRIRDQLRDALPGITVELTNQNRKLILIQVTL